MVVNHSSWSKKHWGLYKETLPPTFSWWISAIQNILNSHFTCTNALFSECRFGWTYSPHTRYCYRRFDDKKLVFEAGEKCEEFSGHLASIHDWYTNNFLVSLTSHLPASEANSWIGLYWDRLINNWKWTDGTTTDGSYMRDNFNPDGPRKYVEFNR